MPRPWSPSSALPLRVLVVDQASSWRDGLVHILNSSPGMLVVGVARNGSEALAAVRRSEPQLVLVNMQLPEQTGHHIARQLMTTSPTRVVMLAQRTPPADSPEAQAAITAGALLVLPYPAAADATGTGADIAQFLRTLQLMAEVQVVRRWRQEPRPPAEPAARPPIAVRRPAPALIAIGASTGGPPVLQAILAALPPALPVPIVIVQHLAAGFAGNLCQWLSASTPHDVRLAEQGDRLRPGGIYLAPDDRQMAVTADQRILLCADPPEHGLRPSVSYLFRSVAAQFGRTAIGVLLTGMGRDGARELAAMRLAGAVTIAQDARSAAVNGMPGAAVQLDAAHHVLPPAEIAALLRQLLQTP